MSIQVGKFNIIQGNRPFIIAEVGSNWHSVEDCMKSIESAKKAGADAVKFQAFTFESLYGLPKGMMPATYSKKYELPVELVAQLKNKADQCGIEFMCTAFDANTLKSMDQYLNAIKIASSDLNHIELLQTAAKMRKPIFLSCGGATENAITLALSHLNGCQVILMYCVAAYPAPSVNLFAIDELRKINPLVGFSDHTLDPIYLPLSAYKNHGAVAIEKHFSCVGTDTPDGYHSLDERGFATMVNYLLGLKKPSVGPLECERDMLLKHKRRLIAIKEIKEGERYVYKENFGSFRSLTPDLAGLSPYLIKEINGTQCRMRLEPGQPITALNVQA